MGDGRAEGLSAIEDGGRAAISLTPDDGTHVHIFESLQLGSLYVENLLYLHWGKYLKEIDGVI